ncbi:hypothetical protein MZ16F92_43190 [Escherichia coli]
MVEIGAPSTVYLMVSNVTFEFTSHDIPKSVPETVLYAPNPNDGLTNTLELENWIPLRFDGM